MSAILIGALGAALSTNAPVALSNFVAQSTGISITVPNPNDPVEKELQKLMDLDDEAQGEVDQWIREDQEFAAKGAGTPPPVLKRRLEERLEPVRKGYEDFIRRHPANAKGRIAYASFLGDTKGEDAAEEQLAQALELDTNNPAIYNNLANIYGHHGPIAKAFEYYSKAIQLNPQEPVYYHNLGTTVYLFRKDAAAYFGLNEQQVFDKTFTLYSNAMRLDPQDFPLATDVAQTYYGVQPLRTEEALLAWTNALSLAHDDIEREGVYIHFVRVKTMAGRFTEARAQLQAVTNSMYLDVRKRLERNLALREAAAKDATAGPPKKSAD